MEGLRVSWQVERRVRRDLVCWGWSVCWFASAACGCWAGGACGVTGSSVRRVAARAAVEAHGAYGRES